MLVEQTSIGGNFERQLTPKAYVAEGGVSYCVIDMRPPRRTGSPIIVLHGGQPDQGRMSLMAARQAGRPMLALSPTYPISKELPKLNLFSSIRAIDGIQALMESGEFGLYREGAVLLVHRGARFGLVQALLEVPGMIREAHYVCEPERNAFFYRSKIMTGIIGTLAPSAQPTLPA